MNEAVIQSIRKRMRRWNSPGTARFITFSCQGRLPLLGKPAIRDLFVESLAASRQRHGFELFAWVVMPEHVHLMLRPHAESRLDEALRSLKTSVAKRVVNRWKDLEAPVLKRIRTDQGVIRFWQKGGGFDRLVRDADEFSREVRYIHRNPVERGLADRPEDWRWSSARWWMGERPGQFECDPAPGDPASWATWLGCV